MKFFDTHTHSEFSPDSRLLLTEMAESFSKGLLSGIVVTDHYDVDVPEGVRPFDFDPFEQQSKIDEISKSFGVEILKGVELGLQINSLDKISKFASQCDFDQIIASVHFVDGIDPYSGDYYQRHDYKSAYTRYLETILENIDIFKNFDILGHFDYIVRYSPYKEKTITMKQYGDLMEEIFRKIIYSGQAFEINTNTYRTRNGETPILDPSILVRYKEMGGEIITLGSDAHEKVRIGEKFEEMSEYLKKFGFKYLAYYKKRKVNFYKID